MYTDIVSYSFIGVVIVTVFGLYIFSSLERKRLKYKKSVFIKKAIKSLLLVLLAIYNLLFAFAQMKYVWHMLVIISSNSLAVIYFFVDFLYYSQRKRAYIVWMQRQVFNQVSFDDVFECIDDDEGEYKEERGEFYQKYPIVNTGKTNGYCVRYTEGDKHLLLKPRQKVDKDVLNLYAQRIELENKDIKEITFNKPEDFPDYVCKEYDKCEDVNSYIFITNKIFDSPLFFLLIFAVIVAVEVLIPLLVMNLSNQYGGLEEWLKSPLHFLSK